MSKIVTLRCICGASERDEARLVGYHGYGEATYAVYETLEFELFVHKQEQCGIQEVITAQCLRCGRNADVEEHYR